MLIHISGVNLAHLSATLMVNMAIIVRWRIRQSHDLSIDHVTLALIM